MRVSDEPIGGSFLGKSEGGSVLINTDHDGVQATTSSGSVDMVPQGEQAHEQERPHLKGPVGGGDIQQQQQQYLNVQRPTVNARPSSDSILSDLSLYAGTGHEFSNDFTSGRPILRSPSPAGSNDGYPTLPPTVPRTWRTMLWEGWLQIKGLVMVMLSQFFGASMNVMTRVLERPGSHGEALGPFPILIARMSITSLASYLYMWYSSVPHPLGTRDIRWLLVIRAFGGFFGVFGMYASLLYLPLSEATVLTFLGPVAACYACSFFMKNEVFTRKQQLAAFISLIGVVLIARPFSGIGGGTNNDSNGTAGAIETIARNTTTSAAAAVTTTTESNITFKHHMLAIAAALLGVVGGACALTAIRMIGNRAHPLVSVTYFSSFTTIISIIAILAIPSVAFRLPSNIIECLLLLGLGVSGFFLQYLLTAGLAYVPPPPRHQKPPTGKTSSSHGSRATSMLYTQMLFALFYDKVIWNTSPSILSWAGSGLILGSALYIAVVRESGGGNNREVTQGNEMVEGVETAGDVDGRGNDDSTSSGGNILRRKNGNEQRDLEEGQRLLDPESDGFDLDLEESAD